MMIERKSHIKHTMRMPRAGQMKHLRRITAAVLAGILTCVGIMTGYAGPLPSDCDETLYITLDDGGEIAESSVVKRYEVKEDGEIVDYGDYESVSNLTTPAEPVAGADGSYRFPVKKEDGAFYFEGKVKTGKEDLPWDIQVSYLLNGVETPPQQLAGQKGLIEIQADLIPNEHVSDFYRNNMALTMAAIVDRDKVLSLRAEGAQIQTVGNMSAVLFLAFPGETCHYTIAIGSDDFEFSGLIFLMMPLTLSQLDELGDLQDAKETLEDSKDAISDSMDILFDTMDHMQQGIADTADGLRGLDDAREIIHSGKDQVYDRADQALTDLDRLAESLAPFKEHTDQAQEALREVRNDVNQLVCEINELEPKLGDLKDTVRYLRDDVDMLQEMLQSPQMDAASQAFMQLLAKTEQDVKSAIVSQSQLDQSMKELGATLAGLQAAQAGLKQQAALLDQLDLDTDYDPEELEELLLALEDEVELTNDLTDGSGLSGGDSLSGASAAALSLASGSDWTEAVTPALGSILQSTTGITGNSGLLQDAAGMIQLTEQVLGTLSQKEDLLWSTLSETSDLFENIGKICQVAEDICTDIDELNGTLEKYHPEALKTLEDLGEMTDRASVGIGSLSEFFRSLENQIRQAGGSLNEGTRKTLEGLADVLDHAGEGLGQTDVLRGAKDTIFDTIDDKWDEFSEEHTTILNLNPDAPCHSLTSDRNPPPKTIQIVMRTKEITKPDEDDQTTVDENYYPEGNVFHRIGLIFRRIWEAICSLFH